MPEPHAKPILSWKDSAWVGLIPAAVAFIVMAVLSWRKWPDPIIDFGGQLYIPWQLSTGRVLYRDVMYLPGPVSQYYHAALFKLFGVSFSTILLSNFAILIGFVVFVYRLFLKCADRFVAGMIALAVLVGFAFAQYLDVGNYNYLSPYSHEIWHGIVLATVLIGCIANWSKTAQSRWLIFGGLCYGLIFLMKPENFLAASGIVFVGLLVSKRNWIAAKPWFLFLLASVVPLIAMFFVFFAKEDLHSSLSGMCGGWVPLVTTHMAGGAFFRTGMGLDMPWFHLKWMMIHFFVLSAVVALCAWRFREGQNRIERIVLFCALAALSLNFDWTHCGRALPLVVFAGLVLASWNRTKLLVPILWLVFALLLLLKMGLYPRIVHYGVFLGMPAFVGGIYCLLWLVPQAFADRLDARRFRWVIAMLLSIGLARLTIQSVLFYHDKDFAVGTGGDRIVTYNLKTSPAGEDMQRAVLWLEANTASNATVAAWPEGVMINYLSRRRNPTPFIVFMSEIYAFGEEKMAAPYHATPPDYVVLVHRETAEYGLSFFGQKKGYGLDLLQWLDANYDAVQLIGAEPLRTGAFGIKIFKRKGISPS